MLFMAPEKTLSSLEIQYLHNRLMRSITRLEVNEASDSSCLPEEVKFC